MSGFHAGRHVPGTQEFDLPGEEGLRQLQVYLEDALHTKVVKGENDDERN
jgi:hypothetical protein